jgi:hypothetical protein
MAIKNMYTQWQRYNGSSWIDIGYAELCDYGYYKDAEGYSDAGAGYNNFTETGLTASTSYDFRLTGYNDSGTAARYPWGTIQGIGT